MEAGFDYLLMRPRIKQRFLRVSGMFLVMVGAILLSGGIAYYVYAFKARSDLDNLNYSVVTTQPINDNALTVSQPELVDPVPVTTVDTVVETVISTPNNLQVIALTLKDSQVTTDDSNSQVVVREIEKVSDVEQVSVVQSSVETISEPVAPPEAGVVTASTSPPVVESPPLQISSSAIASQQLYPGDSLKATYWNNPFQSETDSSLDSSYLRGFKPIDSTSFQPQGTLSAPTHLIIPSIEVETDVRGLEILNLGDSQAYETPNHVVGHIAERSNPGERGSVWLFGHLESPVSGEGNVFYNLPKIPNLLRQGQDVYAIVSNGESSYLYKLTEAFVVHQDQMNLSYAHLKTLKPEFAQLDPSGANIHFVACVPRLVYDHRIVVSGTLVGVRT